MIATQSQNEVASTVENIIHDMRRCNCNRSMSAAAHTAQSNMHARGVNVRLSCPVAASNHCSVPLLWSRSKYDRLRLTLQNGHSNSPVTQAPPHAQSWAQKTAMRPPTNITWRASSTSNTGPRVQRPVSQSARVTLFMARSRPAHPASRSS